jgi:hypothetical protein
MKMKSRIHEVEMTLPVIAMKIGSWAFNGIDPGQTKRVCRLTLLSSVVKGFAVSVSVLLRLNVL